MNLKIEEEKCYKYYLTIQATEASPEKTLLTSSLIWDSLDVRKLIIAHFFQSSHETKMRSWPRFYLHTYENRDHSEGNSR